MWTSDTSRLFHVGSAGTSYLGGPRVISAGSYPDTLPQRSYWAEEFGVANTGTSNRSATITYDNSGFSGVPYTFITVAHGSVGEIAAGAGAVIAPTATGFYGAIFDQPSTQWISAKTFYWRSIGTRVL